jgi:hypothetical protein
LGDRWREIGIEFLKSYVHQQFPRAARVTETSLATECCSGGWQQSMQPDSKVLVILTTAQHQQVAILDLARSLASVSMPARRKIIRPKYLGVVIALSVLFGVFPAAVAELTVVFTG